MLFDPSFDRPARQWQTFTMWKLSGRDNKVKQWSELGEFQNISDAAGRVLELEGDRLGALFFRVFPPPYPCSAVA
jgi:hypothetical protein